MNNYKHITLPGLFLLTSIVAACQANKQNMRKRLSNELLKEVVDCTGVNNKLFNVSSVMNLYRVEVYNKHQKYAQFVKAYKLKFKQLRELRYEDFFTTDELRQKAAIQALKENKTITKIDLWGNNIGDALKRTLIRDNRLLF